MIRYANRLGLIWQQNDLEDIVSEFYLASERIGKDIYFYYQPDYQPI